VSIEQDQIISYLKNTGYAQNPQFHNEDGIFDENIFKNTVADWKADPNQLMYQNWLQTEKSIIQLAKEQTYFNLIKAGVGATLKEGELDYKLANDKVDIQYVRVPFTSIADSTIIVTKSEIATYINEHKDDYKQEKSRDIQFVYFEENPSETDDAAVKSEITKLIDDTIEYNAQTDRTDTISGFRNVASIADFLDRKSDIKFDTIHKSKRELAALFADTLMTLRTGQMFGPYKDGDFYKVAKMVDRKRNGSVKASHILVSYEGAQNADAKITRTKEAAEIEATRLLREAKKSGVVFADLARDNSDG